MSLSIVKIVKFCKNSFRIFCIVHGTSNIYKGWPRITEQTRIVDRQCPLSTSGKSTRILWFISFPTSTHQGESAKGRWDIGMCVRLLSDLYGEPVRKNLWKNNVIRHPLQTHYLRSRCHVGCAGPQQELRQSDAGLSR